MQSLKEEVAGVVIRARAGDQNAMGLLVEVGKAAKGGNSKAKLAQKYALDYIKTNPVDDKITFSGTNITWLQVRPYVRRMQSAFGAETPTDYVRGIIPTITHMGQYAVTTLANGPSLLPRKGNNNCVRALMLAFSNPEDRKAFQYGLNNSQYGSEIAARAAKLNPQQLFALAIGCIVGQARRIQAVRLPNVPISVLSKDAAKELGDL